MGEQLNIFESYPNRPGWKRRGTSQRAAISVKGAVENIRAAVLNCIRQSSGLTADEAAVRLGLTVLSARPRVAELANMGLIFDTAERRANESGRMAIVWRVK